MLAYCLFVMHCTCWLSFLLQPLPASSPPHYLCVTPYMLAFHLFVIHHLPAFLLVTTLTCQFSTSLFVCHPLHAGFPPRYFSVTPSRLSISLLSTTCQLSFLLQPLHASFTTLLFCHPLPASFPSLYCPLPAGFPSCYNPYMPVLHLAIFLSPLPAGFPSLCYPLPVCFPSC
jgi:hypothetical protein